MATTYYDSATESTRNMTRSGRESYVPRHLRNVGGAVASFSNGDSFGFSSESTQYGHHFDGSRPRQFGRTSCSTRGGQGRGRGGSWRWVRRTKARDSNSIRTANSEYPFDVSDKFDELEIVDDTINGSGGVDFDAYANIPVEATGSDVPQPVNAFVEIDLGDCLNNNIHRCKFVRPTPVQQHAIPIAIAGRDLMACAQTGSGKTAAFCFPIISGVLKNFSVRPERRGSRTSCPSALILAPTRELACQIHEEAKKFAYQTGLKIVAVYGGAPISGQFRNMERGVDIMVATPGRLVDMIERSRVSLRLIRYLAIDEADRMLDMGFEHQIRKIVEQLDMPPPGKRQTLLFSATFPIEIQSLASDFLSNYIFLVVGRVGSSTELITQKVDFVQDMDKRNHLKNVLHIQNGGANPGKLYLTLVFVETKKGADALEYWLSINGFPAIAIHGDKVQMERERALKSFKSGATPILVATDVASRGLDIPHVSHVINFDLPKAIDDYVHRIGRTGRAGKSGLATAFFSDKNQPLANALVELLKETNQEIPQWLAERSTSGGQSQQHYGDDKFGGYDFRFAQSGTDNYQYSSSYGGFDSTLGSFNASYNEVSNAIANRGEYSMTSNGDSYSVGTYGGGENYENVVANGWD